MSVYPRRGPRVWFSSIHRGSTSRCLEWPWCTGAQMAERLVGSGAAVTVWNRSPAKAEPLRAMGAAVAGLTRAASPDCVHLCTVHQQMLTVPPTVPPTHCQGRRARCCCHRPVHSGRRLRLGCTSTGSTDTLVHSEQTVCSGVCRHLYTGTLVSKQCAVVCASLHRYGYTGTP